MNTSQKRVKNILNKIEELEKLKDFIEISNSFFGQRLGTLECRYKKNSGWIKKKIKVDDDVVLKIVDSLIKENNEKLEKEGVIL